MVLAYLTVRQQHYFIALLLLVTSAISSADTYKIRGVANLPSETIIDLAKTGKPTWHAIESEGITLHQKLEEICGKQEQIGYSFLESETLKLNRVEAIDTVLKKGDAIAIPFCLKIENNVAVTIKPGDTPEAILKHNYGIYGIKTIRKTYELNVPIDAQEAISIEKFNKSLTPDNTIIIPHSSEIKLLRERETSVNKVPDIIRNIENKQLQTSLEQNTSLHKDPAARPEQKEDYQYIRFLTAEEAQATPDCILGLNESSSFVEENLINRYKIEFNLLEKNLRSENDVPISAIIGIIDTGLGVLGDDFFNESFFKANSIEKNGTPEVDDDGNEFIDDIYGINFNSRPRNGDISFYADDPEKNHGSQIASLVLGGPSRAIQFRQGDWLPIRLKIVNYSKPNGKTIEPATMADAIDYLSKQKARVINMSLSNSYKAIGVKNTIYNKQDDILFVVAAGNKKPSGTTAELDLLDIYPARYGGKSGDNSSNVLTVGAYNLKKELAQFSNFSNEYVDLLAPGCSIETRDSSGNIILGHGTSVATAITTFIAGLITSLGIDNPQQIKNRLLISVDVDEENLSNSSRTKGRLNPIKAISMRNDVLEKRGYKEYIFGHLDDPDILRKFCGDDKKRVSLATIHKIRPNIKTAKGEEIEYWIDRDGKIETPQRCKQIKANESIGKIRIEGATELTDGPFLSELEDIVIARFRN